MKKASTALFFALLLFLSNKANAQNLEGNSEFYTGYMSTTNFDQDNTIKSIDGVLYFIYEDVPVALIRYPAMKPQEVFEVPATVRRICNNAFQGTKFLKTVKIHNRVTEGAYVNLTIGESAFNDSSIENFIVIENNESKVAQEIPQAPEKKDVARYDLSGRKVDEVQDGFQIVVYDDNTSKKVINRAN